MFEFSPIQWFLIGIVASVAGFAAFMLIGACKEKRDGIKVENWKATPERLAMTRRGH